jgi:hypothetical protein
VTDSPPPCDAELFDDPAAAPVVPESAPRDTLRVSGFVDIAWPAKVQESRHVFWLGQCREASFEGVVFSCESEFPVGVEVTLWVGLPCQAASQGQLWTPIPLQVIDSEQRDGQYWMRCVYLLMPPPTLAHMLAIEETRQSASRPASAATVEEGANQGRLIDQGLSRLTLPSEGEHSLMRYVGVLDGPRMQELFSLARQRLAKTDLSPTQQRKLYTCLVEMTRNAYTHGVSMVPAAGSSAPQESRPMAGVALQWANRAEGDCSGTVVVANLVQSQDIARLAALAESLRALDPPSLEAAYIASLVGGDSQTTQAAGLGFGLLTLGRECTEIPDIQCVMDNAIRASQTSYLMVRARI